MDNPLEEPSSSSSFAHMHPLLNALEQDIKPPTHLQELSLKLDEYYFEQPTSSPSSSKPFPSSPPLNQGSTIIHASQPSILHQEISISKSNLIMSDGSRNILRERRPSSISASSQHPVASEPNIQVPLDSTLTAPANIDINLFPSTSNNPSRIGPPGRTLKPLIPLSAHSLNLLPIQGLLKETPLSPIIPLKSSSDIEKEESKLEDGMAGDNNEEPKSETVRTLPSLGSQKRASMKVKKRKDVETAKRLEKALERLDSEIPASLHFDLLEEVLPMVKKMHEMYASQIGEKDELTQLTLSHVEALQNRLPSAHHTHRMMFQEMAPSDGQRMHVLLHPTSSLQFFTKKNNAPPKPTAKKKNFVRMDDLLTSSATESSDRKFRF